MPCYKINITGSVYKTGFRYYLKAKAESLGISGMVFYKNDTTVGAIVSGSEEKINRFLEFCKTGYPPTQIQTTKISEIPHQEFTTFDVVDEKPETLGMRND
jgi:acylphosphatase